MPQALMHSLPVSEITRQFGGALAKSQDLQPPEIARRQAMLLEKLCRHAHQHVPFYRESRRLDPLFRTDGTFDLAGWKDVPVMTRAEARDNEDTLKAELIPPEMLPVTGDTTTGSTGTPLFIRRTFIQLVASRALFDRAVAWNKCGPVRRLAISRLMAPTEEMPPDDPAIPVNIPGYLSPLEQMQIIAREKPSHIIVFPNLVESWIETGELDLLAGLRVVFTTGEILRPQVRSLIERKLNVRVIDFYSATETGPIALAGPDGRLRVSEETLLLEQPSGPVDPSRPVQVVATPFYAYAMPLVRYATGDYIRFSARRPREAIGLRRLEGVLGRERGLFRRRDGTRVWPAVNGDIIADIIELRGWQVVQETLDDLVLKIVTPVQPSADQLDRCAAALAAMVPGFNVRVEVVEKIADERATGKRFESCISLVAS